MNRSNRLFELIQILRAAHGPVTAQSLSETLEVSVRTIYRDIAALQAMRTPIEGEAGIGYMMRSGYDLPPLNFDIEETEALYVGLAMLARTGDTALQQAAIRVRKKIDDFCNADDRLEVAPWGAPLDDPSLGCVPKSLLRDAVRQSRKLRIIYRDETDNETTRTIRPLALVYHLESVMVAAWCELRGGFRHFRTDRIYGCDMLEADFASDADALRRLWRDQTVDASTAITDPHSPEPAPLSTPLPLATNHPHGDS